jgi:hypothetical protein
MLRKLSYPLEIVFLLLFGLYACGQATSEMELLKALESGLIRLTLTAKDGGKTVDLAVENVSDAVLIVAIKKGKTTLLKTERHPRTLICDSEKKIALDKSGSKTLNLPLEMEPGITWTSGTVIIGSAPKPQGKK